MSFGKKKRGIIKRGQHATKCVGVRSIYDILNSEKDEEWKVNYIRHHYTYYEGNYELFCNAKKKHTLAKQQLDDLIYQIVRREVDPSVLNAINKDILKQSKLLKLEKEQAQQNEIDDVYETLQKLTPQAKVEVLPYQTTKQQISPKYLALIESYLNSLAEDKRKVIERYSYSELKSIAKAWQRDNIKEQAKLAQHNNNTDFLKAYKAYAAENWKNNSEEK